MHTKGMLVLALGLSLSAGIATAEEKERKIEVRVTVPDSAWRIAIDSVHQVRQELWVVATVSRDPEAMGLQVISTVKASVKVTAEALPVKCFVLGKTWGWENKDEGTFLKDLRPIEKDLAAGRELYTRPRDA